MDESAPEVGVAEVDTTEPGEALAVETEELAEDVMPDTGCELPVDADALPEEDDELEGDGVEDDPAVKLAIEAEELAEDTEFELAVDADKLPEKDDELEVDGVEDAAEELAVEVEELAEDVPPYKGLELPVDADPLPEEDDELKGDGVEDDPAVVAAELESPPDTMDELGLLDEEDARALLIETLDDEAALEDETTFDEADDEADEIEEPDAVDAGVLMLDDEPIEPSDEPLPFDEERLLDDAELVTALEEADDELEIAKIDDTEDEVDYVSEGVNAVGNATHPELDQHVLTGCFIAVFT
ncbi:hypothetical protein DFJ73DRAFT_773166 [Zopfochytrium polystomum]|nr:hypothetical protein DFJ73DRAFT_773166 [Zopfochytrium polystomum]